MVAIFSLFTVAILSLLVTRIAAMALMFTGLSREVARFQARSAFSGVGFTTPESDLIMNHPVRRKIIMLLMLLGNIGIATVVATVMVSLLSTASSGNWLGNLLLFIGCLSLLWILAVSHFVERNLNRIIAWGLKKWTRLEIQGVSKIHDGDVVVMYGPIERLKELDRRQTGSTGDQAHYDAIVGHQSELKAQAELDELKTATEKEKTEEV